MASEQEVGPKTIYVYTMKADNGFAPNPYHGYCTLACCKSGMRKTIGRKLDGKSPDDIRDMGIYVIGVAGKARNGLEKQMGCLSWDGSQIVYIMQVTEVLKFQEYWDDKRFECKKPFDGSPAFKDGERATLDNCPQEARGDNVYNPSNKEDDLISFHNRVRMKDKQKQRLREDDLGGQYVLVSDAFVYFGDCSDLPDGKSWKDARFTSENGPYCFDDKSGKYPKNSNGTLINTGVAKYSIIYGEGGKYDIPNNREKDSGSLVDFIMNWAKEGGAIYGEPISLKNRGVR